MKKKSIYLETSVISYMAARPSDDLVIAACQHVTSRWWAERRQQYDLFVSELVVAEVKAGDADAASRRLEFLRGIPEIAITEEVRDLAGALVDEGAVPSGAQADALHIAVAAVQGLDYLLTWNCRHIDNPATKPMVRRVCTDFGLTCPEICTPIEIMEESNRDSK